MATDKQEWIAGWHQLASAGVLEVSPQDQHKARVNVAEAAIAQHWTGEVGEVLDMLGIGRAD